MKKRYQLIFSIILLLIGLSGISFFVILSLSKEDMSKWVAALLLSMFMIFYSINDIVDYNRKRRGIAFFVVYKQEAADGLLSLN